MRFFGRYVPPNSGAVMYCDYRQQASGNWQCSVCGDVRTRRVVRTCPQCVQRSLDAIALNRSTCLVCPRHTGVYCSLATGGCEESRCNLWSHWLRRGKCPEGRW